MVDPMSVGAGRPVPPPRPLLRWLRQQADGRGGLQRGGRASGAGLHRQQDRAPQARELRQASSLCKVNINIYKDPSLKDPLEQLTKKQHSFKSV